MKRIKVTLAVAASALLLAAPAMAFHDGGVAKCESCHTMHNSLNGAAMATGSGNAMSRAYGTGSGPYLLQGGGQQSDACLNCHENANDTGPTSYHVSTAAASLNTAATSTNVTDYPKQRGPGGDFGWLKIVSGTPSQKGHNINAPAHGYAQDSRLATSPGGNYPASNLQCSSCHDPHGKYRRLADGTIATTGAPIGESGSYDLSNEPTSFKAVGVYRLLGGAGYKPKSITDSSLAFGATTNPPVAVAPKTYNRTEATTMTRVAYGQGMSEWCANCHGGLLNANGDVSSSNTDAGHVHPAGKSAKLNAIIAGNYNAYKKSGDLSGNDTTSFDSLVPFEEGTADYATLKSHAKNDNSVLNGPVAGTSNVMCLSCHRAHASGFDSMLRYEMNGFVVATDTATGNVTGWNSTAATNARYTAAYYDKPATASGEYQKALCNKCHAKD